MLMFISHLHETKGDYRLEFQGDQMAIDKLQNSSHFTPWNDLQIHKKLS